MSHIFTGTSCIGDSYRSLTIGGRQLSEEGKEVRHAPEVRSCVILTDKSVRIISASEDTRGVFDWTPADLEGRPLSLLIPGAASVRSLLDENPQVSVPTHGTRKSGTSFAATVRLRVANVLGNTVWLWEVEDRADSHRTETTLRQLERELQQTRVFALTGYWQLDLETGALDWSDNVYSLLGLRPRSVRPSRALFLMFVHEEDRATVRDAMRAALRDASGFEVEVRVRGGDDIPRILLVAGRIMTRAGQAPIVVGTMYDATAVRHADRTISILTRAVEQTAEHVMIVDFDGTIEYVNPAFERSSGYLRAEAIGDTPRILKSGRHDPSFYRDLWNRIRAGEPYRGVFVNKRKDGSIYYEEKSISPIRNHRGEITHFVSTGRDITDRQLAEQEEERLRDALRSSVRQWRMTFDAMDTQIVITDPNGAIQRLNRAALAPTGFSFREMVGRQLLDTPPQQPWSGFRSLYESAADARETRCESVRSADGTWWEVSMHTYVDDDAYTIFVARDVTRIRELQELIRRNEMMSVLGRLVAGVAHEVRNPLFGMSATIDAFEGRPLDSDTSTEFTRRLRTELSRLSGLMHDLLEYGRPSEPVRRDDDLRAVMTEAAQMVDHLATNRAVHIELDLGCDPVRLSMDRDRMLQVFRNLLENSIDHSNRGSVVQMILRESPSKIECVVLDEGPGFSHNDLPLVFEPFFTKRRGGTGLGLSIVKRLVEQHDGEIVASNQSTGGGMVRVTFARTDQSGRVGSSHRAGVG